MRQSISWTLSLMICISTVHPGSFESHVLPSRVRGRQMYRAKFCAVAKIGSVVATPVVKSSSPSVSHQHRCLQNVIVNEMSEALNVFTSPNTTSLGPDLCLRNKIRLPTLHLCTCPHLPQNDQLPSRATLLLTPEHTFSVYSR